MLELLVILVALPLLSLLNTILLPSWDQLALPSEYGDVVSRLTVPSAFLTKISGLLLTSLLNRIRVPSGEYLGVVKWLLWFEKRVTCPVPSALIRSRVPPSFGPT